jgi:hypothetical protein
VPAIGRLFALDDAVDVSRRAREVVNNNIPMAVLCGTAICFRDFYGSVETSRLFRLMSGFPPKADIAPFARPRG